VQVNGRLTTQLRPWPDALQPSLWDSHSVRGASRPRPQKSLLCNNSIMTTVLTKRASRQRPTKINAPAMSASAAIRT
jgi:hypothetical protein